MKNDAAALNELIKLCDPIKLRALVDKFGSPRATITPLLLEDLFLYNGISFLDPFTKLVKEGMDKQNLNFATGEEAKNAKIPFDWNNLVNTGGALFSSVIGSLGIDLGGKRAEADAEYYKLQSEIVKNETEKSKNPIPWIIGGVVVIVLIITLVIISKKK